MTCKTLAEAAVMAGAAATDAVHRAKVDRLTGEIADAVAEGHLLPAAGMAGDLSRALIAWYSDRKNGSARP